MKSPVQYLTPGERLRSLRLSREFSQSQLAGLVGVSQGSYSNWEHENRSIPEKYLAPLAAALGVEVASLWARATDRPRGRPLLPEFLARGPRHAPKLPPYDVKGRLDEMLELGGVADDLLHVTQGRLSPAQIARLDCRFPRDTAQELMCVFHALVEGGRLGRETLRRLRCPVLAVETWGSARSAANYERDVLLLEKGDVGIVMVPQVWVPSIVQADWYRLDFLTLVRSRKGTERWADVEIDGFNPHAVTPERDQKRAHGIGGATRVGFWNSEVIRHDFGQKLIARLLGLLERPPASFIMRSRGA